MSNLQGFRLSLACVVMVAACQGIFTSANAEVTGSLTQWQPVEVSFVGPSGLSETSVTNPFLDFRLQVSFTAGGKHYEVPGFFDGVDTKGNSIWKARFTPDQAGDWNYEASFQTGNQVAISLDPNAGTATSFDGTTGSFNVAVRDANAPGFLSKGRLAHTGGTYLQTLGDGKYWLKSGADSPENLLGYAGFDNTPTFRHEYPTHRADWNAGDPDWTVESPNGSGVADGRNLIGAMNYLAEQGVNSVYFLPMNIGGDGKDTSPYAGPIDFGGSDSNDNTRFDISKLAQWELAFTHAQEQGLNLHVVLNEAESPNKSELDGNTLGIDRKLFYREMIARFGHHNALNWNLSEEYNRGLELSPNALKSFAEYIDELDAYDHPLTVHNGHFGNWPNGTDFPDQHTDLPGAGQRAEWEPFFGEEDFDLTSYQFINAQGTGDEVEYLRQRAIDKGRPIAIMIDEPQSITRISVGPNDDSESGDTLTERYNTVRKQMTWDIYFSGGSVEWFVHDGDQATEDFRRFEKVYQETAIARRFMEDHLPFWEMEPADDLLSGEDSDYGGGEVFAKPGEVYAIYLPDASNDENNPATADGSPDLDLSLYTATEFQLRWFNPRTGEFEGETTLLNGGQRVPLGASPDGFGASGIQDWVALVQVVPEPSVMGGFAVLTLLVGRRRS